MKHDRLFDIVTGIVLGAAIGLFYPLDSYKAVLMLISVVGVLRLVALK